MGLDDSTTNTPGWFRHRTKASKNIIDNMTVAEKTTLKDKASKMASEGMPVDQQRK
jgi:hypothetical protein